LVVIIADLPFIARYITLAIMSQDQLIKLACVTCQRVNYWSRKNRKLVERKIELKKYCRWCRQQTKHKEGKK